MRNVIQEMDVIMRLVNVKNTGREEFQGVYHVQGYVGMGLLWGRRNAMEVQDVQVIIVDVGKDGDFSVDKWYDK